MKKDRIFVYVFVALFVIYVVVDILSPKPISWEVTLASDDKNPFGAYILNERSTDIFDEGLSLSYLTISELEETTQNLLVLAEYAEIRRTDLAKLFELVKRGGTVFVGATSFNGSFMDTLDISVHFEYQYLNQSILEASQTALEIKNVDEQFLYPSSIMLNYFALGSDHEWEFLATIDDNPVVIRKKIGEGELILSTIPYVFTNFGMLYSENYRGAAHLLSYLPVEDVHYTMYYHLGRREATTPFRYFLREEALRWSLYLGVLLVFLFLVISSWRKQRPIPVIVPPKNSTVEYVKTLGALFYRERNHKKAAMKLIGHFLHQLKERYFVTIEYSEKFYQHLAAKSGKETTQVIRTFELIQQIKVAPVIEEKQLIDLAKKIEDFD